MRLFGSLTNRIAETIPPKQPEIGMGATILMFSDRYPATIIEVSGNKNGATKIMIQEDTATRTDKNGMSEDQRYEYTRNPEGSKHFVTLRKNGTWVMQGESMKSGTIVRIGERDRYYDFSF